MERYLRIIVTLMLALAWWQTSGDVPAASDVPAAGSVFAAGDVAGGEESAETQAVASVCHRDSACFTAARLPYLPVAELASSHGCVQLLSTSRILRSYITQSIFSVKDRVEKLARRQAVLVRHRSKLFDATACYRCLPVCGYYVFALRRILI